MKMGRYEEVKAFLKKNYFKAEDVEDIRELLHETFPDKTDFHIRTMLIRSKNDLEKIIKN